MAKGHLSQINTVLVVLHVDLCLGNRDVPSVACMGSGGIVAVDGLRVKEPKGAAQVAGDEPLALAMAHQLAADLKASKQATWSE